MAADDATAAAGDATPGYSGKPLAAKLGVTADCRLLAVDAPDDYPALLGSVPAGARVVGAGAPAVDLAHVFATRRETLAGHLTRFRDELPPDVPVWVSWPKKAARVPTDLSEDVVRALALPLGYVDVKVCAVSPVWSALKLVVRRALR